MPKPARYLLLFGTLAVSVCLLATAAALGTLGRMGGNYWHFEVPLGRTHEVGFASNSSRTAVGFDTHVLEAPVSSLHLTLAGLIGVALLLLVVAGIVAQPLFRRADREAEPSLPAGRT